MAPRRKAERTIADSEALLTGFPGFLASFLVEELLRRQPAGIFHFLVQKRFAEVARARADEIAKRVPEFTGRFEFVIGDITDERLGLDDKAYKALAKSIGVVWHLAAIYDLSVPEELAYRVNVGGTNHVLDFCGECKHLVRFNYVSTCFVSGERNGTVFEDELDEGQSHHNHYESTKFWAEVEVQRRMADIPTAVFRPAIVVGHSRTGETDKYDGPYYLLKMLRKLPDWMGFPVIGDGESLVNIIPVDFAASAIAELGLAPDSTGETFHVADPNPMRARDIVALALELMGKAPSRGRLSPQLVRLFLETGKLDETIGVPREVVRYFTHAVRYDSQHCQQALAETDIRCPHLSMYLQALLDYVDHQPDKEFLDQRRV